MKSIYNRPQVKKTIENAESVIYLTDKHLDVLKDNTRFQIFEGKTGSSKSIIGGIAAFHRIFKSPKDENQFAIIGPDTDSLERMVVDNKSSFYNIYIKVCIHKHSGTGGNRIEISTPTGIKKIYLVGCDNQGRFKKIIGQNIKGFILEEAHIVPESFIGELFTRLYRNNAWLYATMNAGLPDQLIYTAYFNKARPAPKYEQDVPDYIWDELNRSKPDPNFRYWFFRFEDNPTLSDQQITELWGGHVPGSFEYNSKILARRGYVEGLLYARLLDNVSEIRLDKLKELNLDAAYIGIDIGHTDKTVFTFIATDREASVIYIIDTHEVKSKYDDQQDYTEIITQFDKFLDEHWNDYGYLLRQVKVDRSNPLFVNQLRNNTKYKVSIQSSRSDKIPNRVKLKQQLLFQNRIVFSNTHGSAKLIQALKRVRSDGKDGHIDEDAPEIDYSDSFDYALEPISFRIGMKKLDLNDDQSS